MKLKLLWRIRHCLEDKCQKSGGHHANWSADHLFWSASSLRVCLFKWVPAVPAGRHRLYPPYTCMEDLEPCFSFLKKLWPCLSIREALPLLEPGSDFGLRQKKQGSRSSIHVYGGYSLCLPAGTTGIYTNRQNKREVADQKRWSACQKRWLAGHLAWQPPNFRHVSSEQCLILFKNSSLVVLSFHLSFAPKWRHFSPKISQLGLLL